MELRTYFNILARRWRAVLLVTVIVFCAAALGNQLMSPKYRAETVLRIVTPMGGVLGETQYQTTYANSLMNTYVQIAKSERLSKELKAKLKLTTLPSISVETVPDSEIIKIIVESENPTVAANAATALADLLCSYQDQVVNTSNSNEGSIWADRADELEKKLTQDQLEHDRLAQAYAEKTAEIAILENRIELKEIAYRDLTPRYAQALASSLTPKAVKDVLLQQMDRTEKEIDELNLQYGQLLTDSNKYLQQITLMRETIGDTRNAYSEVLNRYDTVLTSMYRQDTAQNITIVSSAVEPSQPAGPDRGLVLGLELACGIVLGIASAFVLENLNYSERPKRVLKPA